MYRIEVYKITTGPSAQWWNSTIYSIQVGEYYRACFWATMKISNRLNNAIDCFKSEFQDRETPELALQDAVSFLYQRVSRK